MTLTTASRPDFLASVDPTGIPLDRLRALQLERLQWTVRHAYDNVALYRRKFDEAGVHPTTSAPSTTSACLPFTTKADLRETYPFGMFAVPMADVRRIHASSGTTGRPTVVGYTAGDLDRWADLVARSLSAAGIRPGIACTTPTATVCSPGASVRTRASSLGATVIPMSGGQTARQAQLIQDFEPDAILCTPSYLLTIADALEAAGVDPRSTSLKVAVLGRSPGPTRCAREIERRPRHRRRRHLRPERGDGPGRGIRERPHEDGPHVWEDTSSPRRSTAATRASPSPTESWGSSSSPRSRRRPSRFIRSTAPATSPDCAPARRFPRCGASRRSPAATTT